MELDFMHFIGQCHVNDFYFFWDALYSIILKIALLEEIEVGSPHSEIFETFVKYCQKWHILGEYIKKDEKIEVFRVKSDFIHYIPNRPVKYGQKRFDVAYLRTFLIWNFEIYAGTQPKVPYELNNSAKEVDKILTDKLEN